MRQWQADGSAPGTTGGTTVKVVYVISLATDADTGEESVIWTTYPFAAVPRYYTSSKKSFCAFVEVNGERKAKYKRLVNMKISGEAVERLEEEGFRAPVRRRKSRQPDEAYDTRDYRQSPTYYAYAKDLCEHYNFDRNKCRLCVTEKRLAAITRINRGSVDYLQKKFFSALATLLKERDETEGTCRLRKPIQY